MKKNVWLIGSGYMAEEYYKILRDLNVNVTIIGNSNKSSIEFTEKTGHDVISGGIEEFLLSKPQRCEYAIVSVNVENLFQTTLLLLEYGIKKILLEKPGAMEQIEFEKLYRIAQLKNSKIIIGYNRRFYASVIKAKQIIKKDGGVLSFNFEFTEWAHEIEKLNQPKKVKEKWFLANSTHVVDLAFYLGGKPKNISSYSNGSLEWHPSASNFSGSGISEKEALFSYYANWESAGRWSVEVLTKNYKLIFRPMEKLQIQKKGTIEYQFDETIDYSIDEKYKPGLFFQTKNFLEERYEGMCDIKEQVYMSKIYNKIANY